MNFSRFDYFGFSFVSNKSLDPSFPGSLKVFDYFNSSLIVIRVDFSDFLKFYLINFVLDLTHFLMFH